MVQIYPPLPSNYPPIGECVVKTLLDVRNLSENTQKLYAKAIEKNDAGKYRVNYELYKEYLDYTKKIGDVLQIGAKGFKP